MVASNQATKVEETKLFETQRCKDIKLTAKNYSTSLRLCYNYFPRR